jgi:hypothetical protein
VRWGIVDTETGLWLGDYAGAFLYDSMLMVHDAVTLANLRLGYRAGRLIAREVLDEPERREQFQNVGVEGPWRN